jgi:uncharacterized membrane protein YdfJ with MMPL/SSD domain
MIVVSVDRAEKDVVRSDQPQIERLVSRQISAPVRTYITGQPSIDRALKDAAVSNLRRTELIAIVAVIGPTHLMVSLGTGMLTCAATALLAALAVPAFALKSGPPDVSQLPSGANARIAFEEVSRVMGPGWAAPYNLIVAANNRPLTTPALLGNLYRFRPRRPGAAHE